VPYVQLPTSLLACVDCGIGGKTGVNHIGIKNLIGTVYQPSLVMADLGLLSTIEERELRSGAAEVIKYAAINNGKLFGFLEENIDKLIGLDRDVLLDIVGRCYRIKAVVVEADENDRLGKRIALNFGHTVGHAVEMTSNCRLTHGEAISIGMVAAVELSVRLGLCSETVLRKLRGLISKTGLPTSFKGHGVSVDETLEVMKHDKKFIGGQNRFVLLKAIGDWIEYTNVDEGLLREVVGLCVG